MVSIGSGAKRQIKDVMLTRYACYVIAQNGDPRKEEIAFAQTYFAVQRSDLKRRLNLEGSEVYEKIVQLKMIAPDRKQQKPGLKGL